MQWRKAIELIAADQWRAGDVDHLIPDLQRPGGPPLPIPRTSVPPNRPLGCVELPRRGAGSHRKRHNPTTDRAAVLPDWGSRDLKTGTLHAAISQLGLNWQDFLQSGPAAPRGKAGPSVADGHTIWEPVSTLVKEEQHLRNRGMCGSLSSKESLRLFRLSQPWSSETRLPELAQYERQYEDTPWCGRER